MHCGILKIKSQNIHDIITNFMHWTIKLRCTKSYCTLLYNEYFNTFSSIWNAVNIAFCNGVTSASPTGSRNGVESVDTGTAKTRCKMTESCCMSSAAKRFLMFANSCGKVWTREVRKVCEGTMVTPFEVELPFFFVTWLSLLLSLLGTDQFVTVVPMLSHFWNKKNRQRYFITFMKLIVYYFIR